MGASGRRVAGRVRCGAAGRAVALVGLVLIGVLTVPAGANATYLPLGERYTSAGVAVDLSTGMIYSGDADGSICRVLSVGTAGALRVLAGNGRCADSGDGGSAIEASVEAPEYLAVDGSGDVYTASGPTLRRISRSTGDITAWAGRAERNCLESSYGGPVARVGAIAAEVGMSISGVAVDPISGHLFVLNGCNRGIWEIDESGVLVASYAGIGTERWAVSHLAFSSEGNLYFSEGSYGQQIVKMDRTTGRFTTIAGNGGISNTGDGGPATLAEFAEVTGLAVDSRGYLFLATSGAYIRGITSEGTIFGVAGRPWAESVPNPPYPASPAESGKFWSVNALAVDGRDRLYVSDANDHTLLTLPPHAEPRSTVSWILHERIGSFEGERTGNGNPSENTCDQGCVGDPINTATGEYSETKTDLALSGRGPALAFERTYSSALATTSGPLGYGWTGSYLMSLEAGGSGGMVTIHQENGSTIAFEPNGSGGYLGPSAYLATLAHNEDGSWTLTRRQRDRFVFDSRGLLSRELDLNGETTTLSYEAGRLTTITDPSGRTFRLEYDEGGRIAQLSDSAGRTVRYGYTSGDLTSVVDARGQTWRYAYDEQHRLTRRIDPNEHLDVANAYDSADRVTSQTDADEHVTRFAYEPGMTQITSPAGHVRRDWYASGQMIQREEGVGTAEAGTWRYEYDASTHGTTSVTDPLGHVWRATYDAAGRRTSTTDPLSHTTRATYDSLGDMLTFVDAKSVTTTFTYDERGNLLTRSTPLTGTESRQLTRYVHGEEAHPGDITSIVDPREKTTQLGYDSHGLLTSITDPLGDRTTMTYDEAGNLATVVSPRGNETGGRPEEHTTRYVHDAGGLLTEATDPLGHVTRWAYDPAGNLSSTTDPKLHTTTYGYDAADLLTSIRRANETTLRREYDADGNLRATIDGASNATTYGYDARDRLVSATDPLRRTTTYGYDAAGNRTSLVDPQERTTTYGFDNANRLTSVRYSDGRTPNVTFEYDNAGLRSSMTDGSGTTRYTWDSLGRLTQHTDGAAHTVRYGYDLAGNLTSLTYPGSEVVTRSYDDAGRLERVTDWLRGTTSFSYDRDSDLLGTTYPEASGNVDTAGYDNAGRLTSLAFKHGETTLAGVTYELEANGLTRRALPTGLPGSLRINYAYSALDQLESTGVARFAYDAGDNITELENATPLRYDAASELTEGPVAPGTAEAPATFAYDRDGNRTSATPSGGTATTSTYDQADRLLTLSVPLRRVKTYTYDGDGLMTSRNGPGTISFVWDHRGGLPLMLGDGTNRYVYGPGETPLEQIDGSGVVTYLHHDAIGSTRMLTEARGAATATFSYTPYGVLSGSTGTQTTWFGFAGQYTEREVGVQYMRARFYDPATGQFLTRDPLTSVTGQPYGYANDSPVTYTDPSGRFSWPALSQVATRFVSAIDTYTLGGTADVREALGLNGGLDTCSFDYQAAGGIANVAVEVGMLLFPAEGALEASSLEVRILEGQRGGGIGLLNLREGNSLSGDSRIVGLDLHPIPTSAGRRWRPHLDIPPLLRKHWPYENPR